ncbi:hypothetical protein QHH11_00590 [Aphanizomenon sp. PH219]|nr:hypothetical protein [Aphanizomenon sp. 202]MDK2457651.1 hypothetical protein [Aphanizomenon sp. PH219]
MSSSDIEKFIYQTSYPNEDIVFFKSDLDSNSKLEIIHNGNCLNADGSVTFTWFPNPRLKLDISINSNDGNACNLTDCHDIEFKIPNQISTVSCRVKTSTFESTQKIIRLISDFNDNIEIGSQSSQLSYVIFHIPNFVDFDYRPYITYSEQFDGAVMHNDTWEVTVHTNRAFRSIGGMKDQLLSTGGYAISHVGKIKKVNGSNFTPNELEDIIFPLHYFLAFAKGAWCSPLFPVGFDNNKQEIWKCLSVSSIVDPWRMDNTWFNQDAYSLVQLFPGFMDIWHNLDLRDAIFKVVIHLYIESCKVIGSIEISIVLIQVALETLSWNILVTKCNDFSNKEFKKKDAAEIIRLLLNKYSIPKDIPDEFICLKQVVQTVNEPHRINDGPSVFSYLRNKITHGKNEYVNTVVNVITDQDKLEAWKLGKWYLELVLLGLFNYSGKYIKSATHHQRLYGQEGELVPWISTDNPITSI